MLTSKTNENTLSTKTHSDSCQVNIILPTYMIEVIRHASILKVEMFTCKWLVDIISEHVDVKVSMITIIVSLHYDLCKTC